MKLATCSLVSSLTYIVSDGRDSLQCQHFAKGNRVVG